MENERVESALRNAVYQRNYRRARDRAKTKLTHLYPDQYQELLEEERKRDELEGKKWHSIADSPAYRVANALATGNTTASGYTQEGTKQGNLEGEE
jgi:hypothetical protein